MFLLSSDMCLFEMCVSVYGWIVSTGDVSW
jgi:hypothetical protein